MPRFILALTACALLAGPAHASTVTVVTLFTKELTQAYKTASLREGQPRASGWRS